VTPTLWQRADQLVAEAERNWPSSQPHPALNHLVRELSLLCRDFAATMPQEMPQESSTDLEVGAEYELILRVRARALYRMGGELPCFELQLEDRNYQGGRVVCVDADEIVEARFV
jgi:hypothetical protein